MIELTQAGIRHTRPHRAPGLRPPEPQPIPDGGEIARRQRLHGLISEFSPAAGKKPVSAHGTAWICKSDYSLRTINVTVPGHAGGAMSESSPRRCSSGDDGVFAPDTRSTRVGTHPRTTDRIQSREAAPPCSDPHDPAPTTSRPQLRKFAPSWTRRWSGATCLRWARTPRNAAPTSA